MQAVILAAGMGKRLKELTQDVTKCMIKVNGVTLIERMLSQLDALSLSRIVIVVGYQSKRLISFIKTLDIKTPITYVENSVYDKTNNIYSLYLARESLIEEDTLLLESDLIFEDSALLRLISNPYPNLALVAKYESWMDGTVVCLDKSNQILDFIDKRHFRFSDINGYYKTVNIYKFSKEFSRDYYVPLLTSYSQVLGKNEYYEQILRIIILLNQAEILEQAVIKAEILDKEAWYEIDDVADLDIAESIFTASPQEKLSKFQKRYGGYWRYPKLLDFCYLVNPYYPPQQLMDEIKANFENLITDYPSGLDVNCLLAAKYFGIKKEYILVGNGASELIKALMELCSGKIGVVVPTFEEYANRKSPDDVVFFTPNDESLRYCADDLIQYFEKHPISSLLLINPDNPSGNYLSPVDTASLAAWADEKNIRLIIDESFIDFAESGLKDTVLNDTFFLAHPRHVVVKSISKSFGVAGLRLGILATGDLELLQHIKESVAIWNINSFAEFYLQIWEKYQKDYVSGIEKFKASRRAYISALKDVPGIRVLPSASNYVMCEVLDKRYSSTSVTAELLENYNFFIKDLKGKRGITGDYVRIAVKNEDENNALVCALNEVFGVGADE